MKSVPLILWKRSDFFVVAEFGKYFLDSFYRIQKFTDRTVMVQSIDDESNVFTHITVYIIRTIQQIRSLVN